MNCALIWMSYVQIEEEAVLLLTGLLKLSEAPARAQLQRVLVNLCAHSETRKQVMQILMSMLRAPLSADEAAEASQVCPSSMFSPHVASSFVLCASDSAHHSWQSVRIAVKLQPFSPKNIYCTRTEMPTPITASAHCV